VKKLSGFMSEAAIGWRGKERSFSFAQGDNTKDLLGKKNRATPGKI